jgi:hypothetical protein
MHELENRLALQKQLNVEMKQGFKGGLRGTIGRFIFCPNGEEGTDAESQ